MKTPFLSGNSKNDGLIGPSEALTIFALHILFPTANGVYRKIMFLLMSICLFTGGSHVTIRYGSLPPTLEARNPTPSGHGTRDPPGSDISGEIIIGDLFEIGQMGSLLDPPPNIWWLLKHLRSAQVGGTHRTGMLSCVCLFLFLLLITSDYFTHPKNL